MNTILHKAHTRGQFNFGWLDTKHTFSFARYNNPERMQFGALRVLNDDIVQPSEGFGRHPHDNMEIISIPITGELEHEDSMGHKRVIHQNEVQVMSAGTGLYHSEYNGSKDHAVNFLQIWIIPSVRNIKPVYNQILFDTNGANNQWQTLVHPFTGPGLSMNQNARISRTFITEGSTVNKDMLPGIYGAYFFLISGQVEIGGIVLDERDGLGCIDPKALEVKALKSSYLLAIEIPE